MNLTFERCLDMQKILEKCTQKLSFANFAGLFVLHFPIQVCPLLVVGAFIDSDNKIVTRMTNHRSTF